MLFIGRESDKPSSDIDDQFPINADYVVHQATANTDVDNLGQLDSRLSRHCFAKILETQRDSFSFSFISHEDTGKYSVILHGIV